MPLLSFNTQLSAKRYASPILFGAKRNGEFKKFWWLTFLCPPLMKVSCQGWQLVLLTPLCLYNLSGWHIDTSVRATVWHLTRLLERKASTSFCTIFFLGVHQSWGWIGVMQGAWWLNIPCVLVVTLVSLSSLSMGFWYRKPKILMANSELGALHIRVDPTSSILSH
jgi:uncharacterized membrane protein